MIIDIGNTLAKMVAFRGSEPIDEIRAEDGMLSGLEDFVAKYDFRCGIVGTVRDLTDGEEKALARLNIPILRFSHETPVPITVHYRTPKTLGSSREFIARNFEALTY